MADSRYKEYKTILGDTWDSISYKIYENSLLQDKILKLNPEYIEVLVLPAGINIKYEEITPIDYNPVAPWRR